MRYKDRDELVKGLRDLADFMEQKGVELPQFETWYEPVSITQRIYADSETNVKGILAKAARAMGKAEKQIQWTDFEIVKRFGKHVKLTYETNRENVCVKRVTGTKKVQKRITVDVPGEFVDQEIVEWDCPPSLLAEVSE